MQTTCEQIKLVLISNFLNHHQLPLCEEFLDLLMGHSDSSQHSQSPKRG